MGRSAAHAHTHYTRTHTLLTHSPLIPRAMPRSPQVKRLTDQQRYDVAKAYLLVEAALRIDPKTDPQADPAAHARAKAAIARHQFEALGVKTEKLDPEVAYEQATPPHPFPASLSKASCPCGTVAPAPSHCRARPPGPRRRHPAPLCRRRLASTLGGWTRRGCTRST